jgi:hypothetical protein
MLLAVGAVVVLRRIVPTIASRFRRRPIAGMRGVAASLWAPPILLGGFIAYLVYPPLALAPEYRLASTTHLFWHPVFIGLVSSDPALQQRYLRGPQDRYADEPAYLAVIARLNERNDMSSPIAYRTADGSISIDLMKGWGEYDRLVRPIVLDILREYPLAAIRGLYYKMTDQIRMFSNWDAYDVDRFLPALLLSPVLALLALLSGARPFSVHDMRLAGLAAAAFLIFSLMTPAILPSTLAAGLLGAYVLVIVLALAYVPLACLWQLATRRGRAVAGAGSHSLAVEPARHGRRR